MRFADGFEFLPPTLLLYDDITDLQVQDQDQITQNNTHPLTSEPDTAPARIAKERKVRADRKFHSSTTLLDMRPALRPPERGQLEGLLLQLLRSVTF